MATVEIRADIGNITNITGANNVIPNIIPHTFIQIVGSDGTVTTVGFKPLQEGSLFSPGQVGDDSNHPFDASSGQIQITDQQYQDLMGYIDRMKINPPVYDVIGGEQCASWAVNGLRDAGIISGAIAPQGIALYDTLVWNPYLQAIGFEINTAFTTAINFIRPTGCPIILDLDGDGIETTAVTAGAWFDHASDGFAERTGWAGKDDGLLVRDLNGNGLIDAGAELFGSETKLANGQKAANGFQALAELDSNLDGKIDASDAAFTTLRIWKDIDTDGKTGAGELLTLEQAGVQSINVGYTNSSLVDANGNAHRQVGSYTTAAGQVRAATDVWFQTNPFYSQATDTIPLTTQALALPDMHGAGMVRNLREAASLLTTEGATLAATLTQFAAGTYDVQKASLDSLIRQWSATSTFLTTAGGAYGARPLTLNLEGITTGTPAYTAFLEKLSTLERFNGQTFRTIPTDPTAPVTLTILREQQALIEQSYPR